MPKKIEEAPTLQSKLAAMSEDADWAKVLEWAERAGIENLRGKHAAAHHLIEQANNTLTVLLAGLGGSLAYASKIVEPGPQPIAFGAGALCIYLSLLAALLVHKCLKVRPIPPVFNEPLNLAQSEASFNALRLAELKQLDHRIKRAADRNDETAKWLNNIRTLAVASPIVFTLAVAGH